MPPSTSIKVMPVVSYARAHTELAIQTLVDVLTTAEKDSDKISAARELLSRGWGTPPQSLVVTGEVEKKFDLSGLSTEELRQYHALVSKIVQGPEDAEVVPEKEKVDPHMKRADIIPISPPPVTPDPPQQ